MLEGLDKLDWSKINHSHGTAEKFPKWLKALASPDTRTRRRAMGNVSEYSNHQGSIYPVSPVIIPFLIELLQEETVRDRTQLLSLISSLAWLNKEDSRFSYQMPPVEAKRNPHIDWYEGWKKAFGESQQVSHEKAHQAAAQGLEVYLKLLEHPKISIRLQTVNLLEGFPDYAETIVPRLGRLLMQEQRAIFKAHLLLTMSHLAQPDPAYLDFLRPFLAPTEKRQVRLAASLALARLVGEQTPPEAVKRLLKVVRDPENCLKNYPRLNFSYGEVAQALCNLGDKWSDRVAEALIAGITASRYWYHHDLLRPLFYTLFNGKTLPENATAEELTPLQRQALELVTNNNDSWGWNFGDSTRSILYHYGLPYSQQELQQWLG